MDQLKFILNLDLRRYELSDDALSGYRVSVTVESYHKRTRNA